MNIFKSISDALGGSVLSGVRGILNDYLPPDLSPAKKAELEVKLNKLNAEKTIKMAQAASEAERLLNDRITQQEGTASDLKQLPFVGRFILFLRGCQRPIFGYFTMYIDFIWFTTSTSYTEQQQTALIVINLLVLGFLFGERSIKNLEPLIMRVFGKANEKTK